MGIPLLIRHLDIRMPPNGNFLNDKTMLLYWNISIMSFSVFRQNYILNEAVCHVERNKNHTAYYHITSSLDMFGNSPVNVLYG